MRDIPVKMISEGNRDLILQLTCYSIENPKRGLGLPIMHDDNTIRILLPGPGPLVYAEVFLRADGEAILFWCRLMNQYAGEGPALRLGEENVYPKRYGSFDELKAYEFEPN